MSGRHPSPNRQPAGVPDGGEFAPGAKAESGVALDRTDFTFDIHEWDLDLFSEGDCNVLAEAIAARTGWPVVVVHAPGRPDLWSHAAVRHPSGRYVDVCGIHTQEQLAESQSYRFDWETPDVSEGVPVDDKIGADSSERAGEIADLIVADLHDL